MPFEEVTFHWSVELNHQAWILRFEHNGVAACIRCLDGA